jgi:predicted alpha/beta-hydrolase family hydrolase
MPLPVTVFEETVEPAVKGFIHHPKIATGEGIVLAHGAGSNSESPLLVAVATGLASLGVTVLRIDLPYRQQRLQGPPPPGSAVGDRAGLRSAAAALRHVVSGPLYLGGHSYGGRQSTILASEDSNIADGLLLLSYPLHPPRKPEERRTAHFPSLRVRSLFIQGTRDPFGTVDDLKQALTLIPAETKIVTVAAAGHELAARSRLLAVGEEIAEAWREFFR